MLSFFLWYLLSTLLGWLTFPLAYRLFPALKDRGYTLSRAFGLLIWGYAFWLLASFHIAQNDIGGLLLGLLVLATLSAWAITNYQLPISVSSLQSLVSIRSQPTTSTGSARRLATRPSPILNSLLPQIQPPPHPHNRNPLPPRLRLYGIHPRGESRNPRHRKADGIDDDQRHHELADVPSARLVAFGIFHFVLLLRLCDDLHAGDDDRHTRHRRVQPDDRAHLRPLRRRRVWNFVQLACQSPFPIVNRKS
ncbi:MAG: hypothetical protein U0X92_04740 [Anaerolineales bacterium]